MKKLLKIVAIVVVIAVLLVAGIAVLGSMLSERKMQRVVDVPIKGVAFASGDTAVQRACIYSNPAVAPNATEPTAAGTK